jgi:mannose-6-phosphate isomerase-like protein (cupin superfamily)/NAD-dependent SIR2 family protein deacetylase
MSTSAGPAQHRTTKPHAKRLCRMLSDARAGNRHRTLILGAGASRDANVPDFEGLCERLIDEYELPRTSTDAVSTVQEYFALPGRPRDLALGRVIGRVEPTIGYLHLAQLLEKGAFDLVLTTNWDPLLEMALVQAAPEYRCQVLIRRQVSDDIIIRYLKTPPAPTLLVKLHGDLSAQMHLALTPEEISALSGELEHKLCDRMRHEVVIVGHSLRDEDVRRLLMDRDRTDSSVTLVNPFRPTQDAILSAGLEHAHIVDGELGKFDNFFRDLHVAHEESAIAERRHDLTHAISRIREESERGTNYLNNSEARRKVVQLHDAIAARQPQLVLYIDDPTAPGGSEIQQWLDRDWGRAHRSREWREAPILVKRARSDKHLGRVGDLKGEPVIDLDATRPFLQDPSVMNIAIVDSCSFSGETMLRAGRAVHHQVGLLARSSQIRLHAMLLAMHPSARARLEDAVVVDGTDRKIFADVVDIVRLNRHEMVLPWGATELTSTLGFEVPDLDGAKRLLTRGLTWGFAQVLGDQDVETVRLNTLHPGAAFSFHRHLLRAELFVPLDDGVRMQLSDVRPTRNPSTEDARFTSVMLETGHPVIVPRGIWHRLIGPRHQRTRILEVDFGLYDERGDHEVARAHSAP